MKNVIKDLEQALRMSEFIQSNENKIGLTFLKKVQVEMRINELKKAIKILKEHG